MADSKISALGDGGSLASGDQLVIARSSADNSILAQHLPGWEVGYDQITSGLNIGSTSSASPTTIITCASHTFDGSPVLLNVYFPYVFMGTANNTLGVTLSESGTIICELLFAGTSSGGPYIDVNALRRFTPSASAHTYVIGAYCGNTTGTPAVGAGAGTGAADVPAFARFTKV